MSQIPALLEQLRPRREAVDREIERLIAETDGVGPVADAVRYALATGGKRLRPVLCLAAAEAADPQPRAPDAGDHPARVRAAVAIEIVHTYSLVHDDLPCMDDDDLRRGRPTAHRAFGTVPAALAGFALIPLACRVLTGAGRELGLSDDEAAATVRELCRGAGATGMVGGQVLDLEAEGAALGLQAARHVHAGKTGALFASSLRIGGLLARAAPGVVDALGTFGARLGLAFQITDDVLDETTDAAVLGKTPGKDRGAGKSTFVTLLGLDGARRAAQEEAALAVAALEAAAIRSPLLDGLAGFAVQRDR